MVNIKERKALFTNAKSKKGKKYAGRNNNKSTNGANQEMRNGL